MTARIRRRLPHSRFIRPLRLSSADWHVALTETIEFAKLLYEQVCYNFRATRLDLPANFSPHLRPSAMTSAPNSNLPPRLNRRPRGATLPSGLVGILVAIFVLATALSAYLVFASVRDFVADWRVTTINPTPMGQTNSGGGGTGNVTGSGNPSGGLVPKKWSGADRVTILVMGIDRRAIETDRAYRTDTMMLVSVDPVARTAVMLSIPRDLWVEVPGYGVNKINTANFTGDSYDYPGGGPALAAKTVEYNLGITVDYYVRIDFTAFETLVDSIGGIDVEVAETIDDPEYPDGQNGYEPFYLAAGHQHLNGHDALRYARTRHSGQGDIDRAQRQQQVLLAVRQKVISLNMLPTLIAKAPLMFQSLNENVSTDLTLDQMVALALLAPDIPQDNIQSVVIDYSYVVEGEVPGDPPQQVLIPLRDKIRELRDELFTTSAARPVALTGDLKTEMAKEAARIIVLNGAGVQGLAQSTAEWLQGQGLNVVNYDTADRSDYAATVIVVYANKPYTAEWLRQTFGGASVVSGSASASEVDVEIILGADWQPPTP